jgi:hypothetical protein
MKFIDIDGEEHVFETPGQAVYWAQGEVRRLEKEITSLYERAKRLKEYKERIINEFGLRQKVYKRKRDVEKQQQVQQADVENVVTQSEEQEISSGQEKETIS